MLIMLIVLYDIGIAIAVLLIGTLIMVAREAGAPRYSVRALCLLVWSMLIGWFGWNRPYQDWLLAYELATLLLMALGCVVLWILPGPPVTEAPATMQMTPMETPAHRIKINGKYSSEVSVLEDALRNKYRGKK